MEMEDRWSRIFGWATRLISLVFQSSVKGSAKTEKKSSAARVLLKVPGLYVLLQLIHSRATIRLEFTQRCPRKSMLPGEQKERVLC